MRNQEWMEIVTDESKGWFQHIGEFHKNVVKARFASAGPGTFQR